MTDKFSILTEGLQTLSSYHVPDSQGMLKLDAMENPYALPETMRQELALKLANAALNRYPDPLAQAVKNQLQLNLNLPASTAILLGNGSDELIQLLALAVAKPGAVLLSVEPAFVMYKMIAAFTGLQYVGVALQEDFSLNLPEFLTAIRVHQPALIFLAYPNNPTGNLFSREALLQIIELAPGLVVIDEAYSAFAEDSFVTELANHERLFVMRTLSKVGLAGIRLGYLLGDTAWLNEFEKLRLPYNINVLTQIAASYVLQHEAVLLEQAAHIKAARASLMQSLQQMPQITVYPSQANFILIRVRQASAVFEGLKQRGILIKKLQGAHPLLENCLRITVGTPEENQQLLAALIGVICDK